MGRQGKAAENGLVELIVDKWDGGKKTIVYVTEEVNRELERRGLHITFSRESIRRVVRSYEEEVADAKTAVEAAKAMAEVLKDSPGTEASEAMLMQISSLIAKDLRSIDSLEFESPIELCNAAARITESQTKLAAYRTKAVRALDKAKAQLKDELRREIQNDAELLARLCALIDRVEVQ